jgi:predicted dienelactone hydrolase
MTPHHATPPNPLSAHDRIATASLRLIEPALGAATNGRDRAGAPARVFPTAVRYPRAAAGPYPLIVFSQGFDYPAAAYAGLLNAWARAGFVVAAPTYPFTDPDTPGGPDENDIVNHPADLRFVIASLLARSAAPAGALHGLIDRSQVAVVGQSDGGDVSLAVAADSCCSDPTVKAAVILSGAELSSFGGTYFSAPTMPLLVVQGDADPINVPGCSAQIYDEARPPKYYIDLPGASHLPPYVSPGPIRDHVAASVIAFLALALRHDRAALHALDAAATLPGAMSITTSPTLAGRSTDCPGAPTGAG